VKRRDLINELSAIAEQKGLSLELIRHGANHEVFRIGDKIVPIPRHREIKANTARSILKEAAR
jgi:mRNA interferase HicA